MNLQDLFKYLFGTKGIVDIIITDFNSFVEITVSADPNAINVKDMLMAQAFRGPGFGVKDEKEVSVWSKQMTGESATPPPGFVAEPIPGYPGVRWVRK